MTEDSRLQDADGTVRNWYLASLGVVRYIPRDSVEAARMAAPRPRSARQDAPPEPGSGAAHQRLMAELAARPPAPAKPEPASPEPSPANEPQAQAMRFRLACWQPSPALALLDSLEPGQRPGPDHRALLARMLTRLNQLSGELAAAELIDWPPGGPQAPDADGAPEMMSSFITARAGKHSFRYVLLMGRAASACFAPPGASPAVGDQLELPAGIRGIVTHSVNDLLADPGLRRSTWEAIEFLAAKG